MTDTPESLAEKIEAMSVPRPDFGLCGLSARRFRYGYQEALRHVLPIAREHDAKLQAAEQAREEAERRSMCGDEMRATMEHQLAEAKRERDQANVHLMKTDWDSYFIRMADLASIRSPDPSTQHGCVLVDSDKRVISMGYNGPVQGIDDALVPTTRPEKYAWMIHAEDNAVAFARRDLRGATAYVTGEPCAACFRRLLQVGVTRIVHGGRKSRCITDAEREACREMAEAKGVSVEEQS